MTVFAVLSKSEKPELASKIATSFSAADVLQLTDNQWLISAKATARQLTDKLGITTNPDLSNIVVLSVGSYFGRHNPDVWEWLKVKMESDS